MARLASEAKMGYYPTPLDTLERIIQHLEVVNKRRNSHYLLDPCCGEGEALHAVAYEVGLWCTTTYGVELDAERAIRAAGTLNHVVHGSLFDVRINPLGCMGFLWLNPPYGNDEGERYEMKFLRHSVKWLCPNGVLVFLVPEPIFGSTKNRLWIGRNFYDCRVYRFTRKDFPRFKQVVLFGRMGVNADLGKEEIPPPPYPHIEDNVENFVYSIPDTNGPEIFQGTDSVTDEEVLLNRSRLIGEIGKLIRGKEGIQKISPLLPLRKGHLVALLAAGFLDGRIETSDGSIWIKGYSNRVSYTRVEEDKEITRNTYSVGIRVIEEGGKWYDIK